MKKKILIFLIIFSISIIITYPAFPPSHGLDSYCTMCNGYLKTGTWFLQNGRIFSYLFLLIANVIKLPFDSLGFISVLIGNAIVSLAIVILYRELKSRINFNDNLYNYLLLGLVFLLYYNPLYTSILVYDEVIIMDLGILLLTLASIFLLRRELKNYFIALLLTILGIACYQGIAPYLFVVLIILIIASKNKFDNSKHYFKKIFLSIINYGIAFVFNYIFINLINYYLKTSNIKVESFNIISNIKIIITNLLPTSLRYLFNYVDIRLYYLLVFISIIFLIIFIFKNNNKAKNINIIILLIMSCLFIPFIPNIFMSSTNNYTDARMALTLGIIPTVIMLFILISYKINIKNLYIISSFSIFIFLLTFYSIRQNMLIDLKRYTNDLKYVNTIISEITDYEQEYKAKVDTIYYHHDTDSAYYYKYGNANGVNIRLMAVPWAFECAFNASRKNKFIFKEMTDKKYNELFYNKNYDVFNSEQLIFEDNKLYLLIY